MDVRQQSPAASERRRERRHRLPVLEIAIDGERFRAIDWSMRGALLYGICEAAGVRVKGEIGVPGSIDAMPFTATVVRADLLTGNSAICFEDWRTEAMDFSCHDHACPVQ